ncbi:FMN-binding protein [Peptostreptococcus porci]|uniref:FMN-binding protein n=1 Tax=Peptostreptococcus porci TaxID=2652282 RepID=UPI0023F2665E|nr:FMN-binding protein [Peptostreptococcus porci]MDD7183593.1 FMN-binding protein [Peptostreptococcus porci]MDY5964724.1 FMN-binding protein [Peptostreptococcus porci]
MKAKIDKLICSGIILSIFVGITGYSTGMIYGKSIDDENLNKLKSQFEEELSKNNSDGENSSDTSGSNDSGDKKDSSDSKGGNSSSSSKNSNSSKTAKTPSSNRTSRTSVRNSNSGSTSSPVNTSIPNKLKDGTYYGEANGYAGPVKVKVVVSGGKISDISVESHTETPGYYEKGAGVISSILSAQNTNVDSVSGATFTSNAIKSAVSSALRNAGAGSGGASGSSNSSSDSEKLKKQVSDLQKDKESLKKQLNDALSNSNGVPGKLKDGTYHGESNGYAGPVKVKVVVSGGKISDISVESHTETPGYYEKGAGVISSILSAQSTKVDSVSGATLTSGAIKSAVSSALRSAGANSGGEDNSEENNRLKRQVSELQSEKESLRKQLNDALSNSGDISSKLNDGTYEGSGRGFKGDISVSVKVSNGKIESIDVTNHNDDEPYITDAKAVLSRIVSNQSVKVDSVTGATFSSNGIKTAVKNALKKAGSSGDNTELLEKIDALTLENGNLKSENKKFEKMLEEYKEKIKLLDPNFGKTDDKDPNSGENTDTTKYDGTYRGEAEAVEPSNMPWGNESKYTIKLSVTVKDGKITKIDDSETKVESPSNADFFNKSKDVYKQYIGESVHEKIKLLSKFDGSKISGVDVVSYATVSSNAIHMAIKDALKNIKH